MQNSRRNQQKSKTNRSVYHRKITNFLFITRKICIASETYKIPRARINHIKNTANVCFSCSCVFRSVRFIFISKRTLSLKTDHSKVQFYGRVFKWKICLPREKIFKCYNKFSSKDYIGNVHLIKANFETHK